jgi:hypothetical protein
MTDKANSVAIAAEIETLRADLAKVNGTIDLIGKPAIAKAEQISNALEVAKVKFADALTNEAIEAQKKRLAPFTAIRVEYPYDETSLTYIPFTIKYCRLTYDYRTGQSVPKEHECNGFAALPNDAYEYLVTMKPEAIPAPIMKLAPGDPHGAFRIYLAGKARGYFKG